MQSAIHLREKGNEALRKGDPEEAERWYDLALEGCKNSDERAKCLSNRAATRMARGALEDAMSDAQDAVDNAPEWYKARARLGEVLRALGRHGEATVSFSRALDLHQDERSRERVVECISSLVRGVKVQSQRKVLPGMKYRYGELVADAEPGALSSLVEICTSTKDNVVRLAGILHLSLLAGAPDQKKNFFDGTRAIIPLIDFSMIEDLDRDCCARGSLPQRFKEIYKYHLGSDYDESHPLTVAAFGFSRIFANLSACPPDLDVGLEMLRSPSAMKALSKLVRDTQGFDAAQNFLCECYRHLTETVSKGGSRELEMALSSGLKESLEMLHRDAIQNDRSPVARYLERLLTQVIRHPDHPDNQVPSG